MLFRLRRNGIVLGLLGKRSVVPAIEDFDNDL
jgi:hypothetical protein